MKKKYFHFLVAMLAGGFFVFGAWAVFSGPTPEMPESFASARLTGAAVGGDIVELIESSHIRFQQISDYDSAGDYDSALNVSLEAVDQSRQIPAKAKELSEQLEIMTRALPEVYPEEARSKAQSAILTEVKLINKLIEYSSLQQQLLQEIQLKLQANINGGTSTEVDVQSRIDEINREIRNINLLNEEFLQLMKEFDAYFEE